MKPEERMRELTDTLNRHAELYYRYDSPVISDGEYDALYDELLSLERETGLTLPDSPTRRVGDGVLKEFVPYRHTHKLYSLDKCKDKEEFLAWYARAEKAAGPFVLTAEYKFDGLTINLTYVDGELVSAATRGDGETGENVTTQVRTIRNVPLAIPCKDRVEVQGEGVMRLSVLKRYNETHDEPLKNARNAAAGAIRNLNPRVTASRNLDVMCYNVSGLGLSTQSAMHAFLEENGFETGGYFRTARSAAEASDLIDEITALRPTLDFLIDGVVFKIEDLDTRSVLGETEKFPRWAVAYKFRADEATTVLREVVWRVSRTGKLNPLAILDPVDLAGVTVRKATLNNFSDLTKKGLKTGSRVFVRRSNDVIPEILGVAEHTPESRDIPKPSVCPHCGSPVEERGAFLYCTNPEGCVPRTVARLAHFAEKGAMDIDGYSDKTAELLLNELNVRNFSDLYTLTEADLSGLEGFGEAKARNLINSIEKSKKTTLGNFLYALGIRNVGKKAARDLENAFGTLDNVRSASAEDIERIDDFGSVTAEAVTEWFRDSENAAETDRLLSLGVDPAPRERRSGAFAGRKVVFTGSLERLKRSEAEKIVAENGGEVSSSVSKSVNLVVAGADPGSKLEKAKKLGIEIVDEAAFAAMAGENA